MSVRDLALAAVALTLCLGGCSSTGAEVRPAAPPSAPTGRAAAAADGQLRQYRGDAARRVLQVTVTAHRPVHVSAVSLSAPGFATATPASLDVDLPLDSPVDLPVPYGDALCDRLAGRAVATLTVVDRPPVAVELTDDGLLTRLHTAECTEQELLRQVAITVGPDWTEQLRDGRKVLLGTLQLERRAPGQRVVVDSLGANVVYSVRGVPERKPLVVLGPTEATASLSLELSPTRCDSHALAESKATSLLLVYVGLEDAPARSLTVTPDPASRLLLEEFAVRGCRS